MRRRILSIGILVAGSLTAGTALAQQAPIQDPALDQMAEECIADLQELNRQARQEGYWLAGWRPGMPPAGTGVGTGAPPHPEIAARDEPFAPPTTDTPRMAVPDPRFHRVIGPRQEMQALFAAAEVLAWRGNEEGCRLAVNALAEVLEEQITLAREAGLDRGEMLTWRQQQILEAPPVTEVPHTLSADSIVGADLRNARDEDLGTIDNIVMDRERGQISHVVVSRGGFLGIGEDHYAVPWQVLRAAPVLNTFVLDVPEEVAENAPEVDRETFAAHQQEVDQYWQQHLSD